MQVSDTFNEKVAISVHYKRKNKKLYLNSKNCGRKLVLSMIG